MPAPREYVAQDAGGWYVRRIDPCVYNGTAYTVSGPWPNRETADDILRQRVDERGVADE